MRMYCEKFLAGLILIPLDVTGAETAGDDVQSAVSVHVQHLHLSHTPNRHPHQSSLYSIGSVPDLLDGRDANSCLRRCSHR